MPEAQLIATIAKLVGHESAVWPGHGDFEARRMVWNGMIDRRPAVIARPASAEQVAQLVILARTAGLALSIRGGGHSFPGFSTCDNGLVIDLSHLNRVAVDPAARVADVGGGALLGDLDRATAPYGLVTPAGLVSHTGAGGLTLGGGMGWTSRRLGLTIDNLLEVDLVTSDGSFLTVTAKSDPDLFWGLCGGGGNFGVATRFRYRLHPLGPVTIGYWKYPLDRAPQALATLSDLATKAPRSQTTVVTVVRGGLVVTAFHSGPDGLGRDSVLPFGTLAGPGEGGLQDIDYVSLQSRSDDNLPWGRRYYGKGGFFAAPSGAIADCAVDLARSAPTDEAEIYMIQLGGAVADIPEEATAYSGRKGGFYWIAQPIWDNPADDDACLRWGRNGGARLAALSQAGNYLNEQGEVGLEQALQAYGPAKYQRLARLKARMDRENLFRLNQNIPPAA